VRPIVTLLWLVSIARLVAAPSVNELAELFMPPEFQDVKVSPDGRYLGFIGRKGDDFAVGVYDLRSGRMDMARPDPKVRPLEFWWKTPTEMLVRVTNAKQDKINYVAVDAEGGKKRELWRLALQPGRILDAQPADPQHVLMTTGRETWRVNVESGDTTRIEQVEFLGRVVLDARGRAWSGYLHDSINGKTELWWRTTAGGAWRHVTYEPDARRFLPISVEQDGRALWGWAVSPSENPAVAKFDSQSGEFTTVDFLKGFQPSHLLLSNQTRELLAAGYAQGENVRLFALEEKNQPGIARLQKTFEGFFPAIHEILPDNQTWLAWVGNSRLPGAYFFFNHRTGEASLLAMTHSAALTEDRLAASEYFTFPQRGGGVLSARLWRPAKGTKPKLIVFCPDSLPDTPAFDLYDPEIQSFVAQGFAVLRVHGRGTSGFSRTVDIMKDPDWSRFLQEDLEDAVDELVRNQVVDPRSINLYGSRLGAVLAIEVAANSQRFTAVATVNAPAKLSRYDLFQYSNDLSTDALSAQLGWGASGKLARDLSPIQQAPRLTIPALYLHNEESIKGRANEDGRQLQSAAEKAPAPAKFGLAYSWTDRPRPPSALARNNATISLQIGEFYRKPPTKSSP
jgi:dipeptidyl aminopeptidase/acylaminoacyl peptidase